MKLALLILTICLMSSTILAAPINMVTGRGHLILLKKLPETSFLQDGVWIKNGKVDQSKSYCEVLRRGARIGESVSVRSMRISFSTASSGKQETKIWLDAFDGSPINPWLRCSHPGVELFDISELTVTLGDYFELELESFPGNNPNMLELTQQLKGRKLLVEKDLKIIPGAKNVLCAGEFNEQCAQNVVYGTLYRLPYTLESGVIISFDLSTLLIREANGKASLSTDLILFKYGLYERMYIESDGERELSLHDFKKAVEPTFKIVD